MAEKIYPASQHKRKKEREKGNVVKSTDIITLVTLFVTLSFVYYSKDGIFNLMNKFLIILNTNIDKEFNIKVIGQYIELMLLSVLPLLGVTAIAGFIANYFQVGLKFTPKTLAPDVKKINPISGFKRMFSKDSLVELGKSLLKVIGVLYIAITEIKAILLNVNGSYTTNGYIAFSYIYDSVFSIVMKISMLLLAIALVDFTYKKFKHEKDMMMTREEMMEEFKQTEGNPHTKNRQKELGRMLSKKQIQKVKQATVVVTNPTHFAVALKYDRDVDYAPVVLFKGVDEIAQAAKKIASENNIPMIENKPLARALYAKANEGDYIPDELFESIAEIIGQIYLLNEQKI